MKVSKPPALATERYVNSNNGPSLSPDGQYLAYISLRPEGVAALVVRTLATGEEREVTRGRFGMVFGYGPMWFPDGRSVLMLSRDTERPGLTYNRVDLASGNAEILHHTGNIQGYKLSSDGKAIFYSEVPAGGVPTRLMRFDLDTRRETELKKGEWFIALAVSPDGKQLAYLVSVRPGAASYLAVMPTAGGESREVFRGSPWMDASRYNTLAWTPDQRYLLFVRGGVADSSPNVLWRVPVAGGQPEQMGVSMQARIRSPQVQPDGRRIFFSANESSGSEVWALENFLPKGAAAK
jgi:Tol biopolymer transport system component